MYFIYYIKINIKNNYKTCLMKSWILINLIFQYRNRQKMNEFKIMLINSIPHNYNCVFHNCVNNNCFSFLLFSFFIFFVALPPAHFSIFFLYLDFWLVFLRVSRGWICLWFDFFVLMLWYLWSSHAMTSLALYFAMLGFCNIEFL